MSVKKKQRKSDRESRVFNTEWEEKYLFTDVGSIAKCLICDDTISIFKDFNVNSHFTYKHKGCCANLS